MMPVGVPLGIGLCARGAAKTRDRLSHYSIAAAPPPHHQTGIGDIASTPSTCW